MHARAVGDVAAKAAAHTRALLVMRATTGEVLGAAYGPEPWLGPDALMHGWSMSKSVLAVLVGMRVHEGALSLDEVRASAVRSRTCSLGTPVTFHESFVVGFAVDF